MTENSNQQEPGKPGRTEKEAEKKDGAKEAQNQQGHQREPGYDEA